MQTGIYLRISTDHAREDADDRGAGVKRQREDCLKLADEMGWQVVDVYEDNDVSASSTKPRPRYRQMIADIETGRINSIIAWHTDRLYRRLADLEELAKICDRHSLSVRTCRSGELDMSTPTGRMIARILGSVATYEVEQKADRWRRSVRQRREAGRWWNSANRMFGYTRDGELVEREAEALRHVASMILAGSSAHASCQWLNQNGYTTTRGNDWMPPSLRATLRSPKIAGLSALKGEVLREGGWDPILDRDTWERVVAAIRTRANGKPQPRRSLLGGLLICGVCKKKLIRNKTEDGMVYRCQSALGGRGHVSISAPPAEEMVEAYARARLSTSEVRLAIAARLSNSGTHAAELTQDIDRLDREIIELGEALRTAGKRSKLELTAAIDELDAELAQKRTELSRLTPVALPVDDEWPDDIPRRRALIELVVEKVTIKSLKTKGGPFNPKRVRIKPVELPKPE